VKRKIYSHIIGIYEELWDIVEDGIDIPVYSDGIVDIQEASYSS